jgi:hypothetical protein
MIIELIIVILGMLATFVTGFYFGYLKREDKPPEMPVFKLPDISVGKKDKEAEPKGFYD